MDALSGCGWNLEVSGFGGVGGCRFSVVPGADFTGAAVAVVTGGVVFVFVVLSGAAAAAPPLVVAVCVTVAVWPGEGAGAPRSTAGGALAVSCGTFNAFG